MTTGSPGPSPQEINQIAALFYSGRNAEGRVLSQPQSMSTFAPIILSMSETGIGRTNGYLKYR
jgi:hypothetical protein